MRRVSSRSIPLTCGLTSSLTSRRGCHGYHQQDQETVYTAVPGDGHRPLAGGDRGGPGGACPFPFRQEHRRLQCHRRDFLADFRKKHRHGFRYGTSTKFFFYCLPSGCLEAAYEELDRHADELFYSGIITYDEDLNLEIHGRRFRYQLDNRLKVSYSVTSRSADPLFIEQRLELARLGCMRVVRMKKNSIKESCNIKDSKEE